MKKGGFLLFVLAALLLTVTGAGAARVDRNVYFAPAGDAQPDGLPADAVMVQQKGYKYYLFLPGNTEISDLRVWFDGENTVSINGTEVHSGDAADMLVPGETAEFLVNRKKIPVQVYRGSALPALFVSTESGSMARVDETKKYKEPGYLAMRDAAGAVVYDGALTHVKLRGNTSAQFSKKGYQIKLAEGTDLLGMGKAKKWVLTANYRDHSLIRNQVVFAMSEYIGMPWTPECRPVELYLNHAYNGLYLLQEKVEIGRSRVNIRDLESATEEVNSSPLADMENLGNKKATAETFKYVDIPNNPEDITGGYLLEFESWNMRYAYERCAYTTRRKKVILVKEPENASEAQMTYISRFMQGFEDAVFQEDGRDPETGKAYYEFVDLESLAMKYMLEEVSMNLDANASSQFFFKPADSQSTIAWAGPAWDYDTSLGVFASKRIQKPLLNPEAYWADSTSPSDWWTRLCTHPEFMETVHRVWQEKFSEAIDVLLGKRTDPAGRIRSIDEYVEEIRTSAEMNFVLWPIRESKKNLAKCGDTFDENVEYVKNFLERRQAFLEGEWGPGAEAAGEQGT